MDENSLEETTGPIRRIINCRRVHSQEQSLQTISQFRSIALLNVKRKVFFLHPDKETDFIMVSGYVDTSCQNVGIPGFPMSTKHSSPIWNQIQHEAKSDLHLVQLDLTTNVCGSVSRRPLDFALGFLHILCCVQHIITNYFSNLHMCSTLEGFMTGCQELECRTVMRCAIFPILFVVAFEVILRGQADRGIKLPSGGCFHHYGAIWMMWQASFRQHYA